MTKEERQLAKAVNFGLLYGQGAKGLQAYAASTYGVEITLEEAGALPGGLVRRLPGLPPLAREGRARGARRLSGPHTGRSGAALGSREYKAEGGFKLTEAYNMPVQGGAAEVMLAALGHLMPALEGGLDAVPVAVVHDEISSRRARPTHRRRPGCSRRAWWPGCSTCSRTPAPRGWSRSASARAGPTNDAVGRGIHRQLDREFARAVDRDDRRDEKRAEPLRRCSPGPMVPPRAPPAGRPPDGCRPQIDLKLRSTMPITARSERGKIAKGTAGRTPGSRNHRTRVADLVDDAAMSDLVRVLHAKALEGDAPAAKLLLDRLDPAPKLSRVCLTDFNASTGTPEQALHLAGEVLAAAARGEVGLDEARAVVTVTRELAAIHAAVVGQAEIDALRREIAELKAFLIGPGTIQALPRSPTDCARRNPGV